MLPVFVASGVEGDNDVIDGNAETVDLAVFAALEGFKHDAIGEPTVGNVRTAAPLSAAVDRAPFAEPALPRLGKRVPSNLRYHSSQRSNVS